MNEAALHWTWLLPGWVTVDR